MRYEGSSEPEDVPAESSILSHNGGFSDRWLSDGPKSVVPVPTGTVADRALLQRLAAGCRAVGSRSVLLLPTSAESSDRVRSTVPVDEVMAQLADFAPPGLLATSDLNGAVLFLSQGYALVAGTPLFLRSAVPEGVDGGRARFARYAHRVKERWPELSAVTQALPPRHTAWSHVQDIPPGTGTARQVELMRGLVGGECSAADFARGWLDARRVSLSNGERLQRSLSLVLDEVFALLENYAIDPSLKEPGDLSDDELKREVRRLMQRATGWLE